MQRAMLQSARVPAQRVTKIHYVSTGMCVHCVGDEVAEHGTDHGGVGDVRKHAWMNSYTFYVPESWMKGTHRGQ
jgi:hypothetical protein